MNWESLWQSCEARKVRAGHQGKAEQPELGRVSRRQGGGSGGLDLDDFGVVVVLEKQEWVVGIVGQAVGASWAVFIDRYWS